MLINVFPDSVLRVLPSIVLVVAGFFVEKNFVGRITTFSNSIAINLYFITIKNLNVYWTWYANIGLILGIIGLGAYIRNSSLPKAYYVVSLAYCSIVVGILLIVSESIFAV